MRGRGSGGRRSGRPLGPGLKVLVAATIALPLAGAAAGLLLAWRSPFAVGYGRQAMALEARANLERLVAAVESHCRSRGALPPEAGPVPPEPSAEPVAAAFEMDPGFAALGFAPGGPVRHSYRITPAGPGRVRLVATGDLDGDGLRSELSVTCQIEGCACSPGLEVRDELE